MLPGTGVPCVGLWADCDETVAGTRLCGRGMRQQPRGEHKCDPRGDATDHPNHNDPPEGPGPQRAYRNRTTDRGRPGTWRRTVLPATSRIEGDDGFRRQPEEWATSKATELRTADGQKRESASADAEAAESRAKSDLGETLLRTAFPKVGEWADQQEAHQTQREKDRIAKEEAEVAALPAVSVSLSVTGALAWQWSGTMRLRRTEIGPRSLDPEEDYDARDPT